MDTELQELERAARRGEEPDVERYLAAMIRRSPDLSHKLVRRLIRLERVVMHARANEEQYFAPVTTEEFLGFLERDTPERGLHAGALTIEGEWGEKESDLRGGRVVLQGGLRNAVQHTGVYFPGNFPGNQELHAMIQDLTARVQALEDDAQ